MLATNVPNSEVAKAARAIQHCRDLYRDILANEMMVFLYVAANESISMQELQLKARLSQAATSRNVNFLTKHGANGRPGTDLIQLIEDPRNRRRRLVYLTASGRAFLRKLEAVYD